MIKINFSYQGMIVLVLTIASLCRIHVTEAVEPSTQWLRLSDPYWRVGRPNTPGIDAAGFSDNFFWGTSPRHNFEEHEMLSGEWGAAIYYPGISIATN